MKKLFIILLSALLAASCMIGCGKSESVERVTPKDAASTEVTESSSAATEEAAFPEDADQPVEMTLTYAVTDPYTGETGIAALTYRTPMVFPNNDVLESTEPVADLTMDFVDFYHTEYGTPFSIRFLPGYYGDAYYQEEVAYRESHESEATYVFSDCTETTIGSTTAHTYTEKITFADGGTLDTKYWMLQFEAGTLLIESFGDEEELSIADEAIKDLLVNITIDGAAAGTSENTFTMYDYNTAEPIYTVTFDPRFFSVSAACDPRSGEIILNCLDAALSYPEMLLYVNKYPSGESLFNSKSEYSYGISYYGTPGNYLETGGTIGDATVYLGYGLAPSGSTRGYVFFAEMTDGNVITGNIPNTEIGDRLLLQPAFLAVDPAAE